MLSRLIERIGLVTNKPQSIVGFMAGEHEVLDENQILIDTQYFTIFLWRTVTFIKE